MYEDLAWIVAMVRMRAALRRRDLFASPRLRYADPRAGLLDGAAWESARPAVCRSLGVSASGSEEVARMAGRLDAAYRATAARLPGNASVRIEMSVPPASSADRAVENSPVWRGGSPVSPALWGAARP